jgi:hypothetical protein
MAVTSSVTYVNTQISSSVMIGKIEDASDYIHELSPWNTPLLNIIPGGIAGITVGQPTHYFHEQEWTPGRTTLASALTAAAGSIKFSDKVFRAGEQVRIDSEIISLTATSDNASFTCGRTAGYGATATHTAGALCIGANTITAQGSAAGTALAMVFPKQQTNYTCILKEDIMVSGTADAVKRYGRGGQSEYDYQKERMLKRVFKQLEERVWFGFSQAASTTATGGNMKGIFESVQGTNSAALAGANPTWDNLVSYVNSINAWDDNKSDLYLFCSLYYKSVLDSWAQGKLYQPVGAGELPNSMLGSNVQALFIGGRRVIVIPDNYFDSQAAIINPAMIKVGPLAGRAFFHQYFGSDGDRVKGMVCGEYTCEVACPHAHYVLTGMKTS